MNRIRFLMCVTLAAIPAAGCERPNPPENKLKIDAEVTKDTGVSGGSVSLPEMVRGEGFIRVNLAVPDSSKVLQFKNPRVEIDVYANGSAQNVIDIPASLSAGSGSRSFTFSQTLTSDQLRGFQRIVIKRIYEPGR